jgi:hypothetical protein
MVFDIREFTVHDGPGLPGASWADVSMDVALPMVFRSDLSFSVKLPKDVRVLLDAVQFVPVRK